MSNSLEFSHTCFLFTKTSLAKELVATPFLKLIYDGSSHIYYAHYIQITITDIHIVCAAEPMGKAAHKIHTGQAVPRILVNYAQR
jgi:hypothetical protein